MWMHLLLSCCTYLSLFQLRFSLTCTHASVHMHPGQSKQHLIHTLIDFCTIQYSCSCSPAFISVKITLILMINDLSLTFYINYNRLNLLTLWLSSIKTVMGPSTTDYIFESKIPLGCFRSAVPVSSAAVSCLDYSGELWPIILGCFSQTLSSRLLFLLDSFMYHH